MRIREVAHHMSPGTRWKTTMGSTGNTAHRESWNKGKIVGQKAPFKLKEIWVLREPALFNLGYR